MNKVEVTIFNKSENELPFYGSELAAGFDLKASFIGKEETKDFLGNMFFSYNSEKKELTLFSNGGRVLIPTGIHIGLPENYELQIRPRSGLALKHGISIVNSPGTIDSDYRGEIGIILINTDPTKDFIIKDGERIGQGILKMCEQVKWIEKISVEELGDTQRGQGGFGHTGK